MKIELDLIQQSCWCGLQFAIPQDLKRMYDEEGQKVFCPLGHIVIRKKTDCQILKEENEKLKTERNVLEACRDNLQKKLDKYTKRNK